MQVARLFGLRGVQHTPLGARSGRISQHYKASLSAVLHRLHPAARYVIVVEEDLDVAPDFFEYVSPVSRGVFFSSFSFYVSDGFLLDGFDGFFFCSQFLFLFSAESSHPTAHL